MPYTEGLLSSLDQVRVKLIVIGWDIFSTNGGFFGCGVTTRHPGKAMTSISTGEGYCQFLFLEENIERVATGFEIVAVIETTSRVLIDWNVNTFLVFTFWAIHIFVNILDWFSPFFRIVNPLVTQEQERVCLFFKVYITELIYERTLRTLIITSAERLKKLFVHRKYRGTHFVRTIHVPKKSYYCSSHANNQSWMCYTS